MPKIDLGKVIGKDFKYEDFTPEQLKALQIKGDAGDNKINVVKDGIKTREDLTLQQEGKFTKIVSGTSNSHKLLASDILTEDGNPIMDTVAQFSNPNLLINGGFQVWQRGTTFTGTLDNIYTADRWKCYFDGTCVIKNDNNSLVFKNTNSTTTTTGFELSQWMEERDFSKLKGKKVTLSIRVKAENVTSGNFTFYASDNKNVIKMQTFSVLDFLEYKEVLITFEMPSNFENPRFVIGSYNSQKVTTIDKQSEIINVGGSLIIDYIKLELGSIATPFVPRSYAEEIVLCKRYFQTGLRFASGYYMYTTYVYMLVLEFEEMRIPPSVNITSAITYGNGGNSQIATKTEGTYAIKTFLSTTVTFAEQVTSVGCFTQMNVLLDAEIY